jgi:internalin A
MLQEYSREAFVSYAWGGASEKLVDLLEQALKEEGINIVRDKRNLPYKGIIKEFMERLGRSQCIVVVISDKYLKSKNCMFELMEIFRNGQLHDRIFPIILPDARI